MYGKGPWNYTQMSAIFLMLHNLNPQILKLFKTLHFVVVVFLEIFLEVISYGKPIKSCIVLVIVYVIYTEAYLEPSRTSTIEPFCENC